MPRKLYRVKVVLYVMGENESEARVAATDAHFDIFECTARKAENVDPAWVNAIPYNNAGDERTCAEILAGERKLAQPAIPFPIKSTRSERMRTRPAISYVIP